VHIVNTTTTGQELIIKIRKIDNFHQIKKKKKTKNTFPRCLYFKPHQLPITDILLQ